MRNADPAFAVWAGAVGGAVVALADIAFACTRAEAPSWALVGSLLALGVPLFVLGGAALGVVVELALWAAGWKRPLTRALADEGRPGALAASLVALVVLGAVCLGAVPAAAWAFAHQRTALAVLAVAVSMGLGAWGMRAGYRFLRRHTLPRTLPTLLFTSAMLALLGHFVFREGGPLDAMDARPFAALGAGLFAALCLATLRSTRALREGAVQGPRRRNQRVRRVLAVSWRLATPLASVGAAAFVLVVLGAEPELRAFSEGGLVGNAVDSARALLRLDAAAGSALRAWAMTRPKAPAHETTPPSAWPPTTSSRPAASPAGQPPLVLGPTPARATGLGLARQRDATAPHVVLITVDALRADHLGLYGYGRGTSPELDAFARGATVFERAYSQETKTKGSIPSLLTGRYPSSIRWGGHRYVPLHPSETTWVEDLLSAGYHTAGFVTHSYFLPQQGMARGFAHYDTSLVSTLPDVAFGRATGAALTDKVVAHLGRLPRERPFFLWAHYFDPHERYLKHAEFSRFGDRAIDRYDGEIAYTDHHLGRLLRALLAHPEADRMVIIVTADHGEAFGEHGTRFHGRTLYEEEVRVPLLVRAPGLRPSRVATPVALIDLAPSVFALAGLPAAPGHQGRSLVPALRGETLPVVPVFAELLPEDRIGARSTIVLGDHKLIFDERRNALRLFDLQADPLERRSLLAARPDLARDLAARLLEWRSEGRRKGGAALQHGASTRLIGTTGLTSVSQ